MSFSTTPRFVNLPNIRVGNINAFSVISHSVAATDSDIWLVESVWFPIFFAHRLLMRLFLMRRIFNLKRFQRVGIATPKFFVTDP